MSPIGVVRWRGRPGSRTSRSRRRGRISLRRPRPVVVRVAAARPVAAGAGGDPPAVRVRAAVRSATTPGDRALHARSPCCSRRPSWPPSSRRRSARRTRSARFVRPDAVHGHAAADQRRARRRQAEDGDLEHAGRVAPGPGRDPARADLSGTWPVVIERARTSSSSSARRARSCSRCWSSPLLLASTWKQLVQGLSIGLTGREGLIKASVLLWPCRSSW